MKLRKSIKDLWRLTPTERWISPVIVGMVGAACVTAACGLACLLGPTDSEPPPGFQSRVMDSIAGMSILEFSGGSFGVECRSRHFRDGNGTRPLNIHDLSLYIAAKHGAHPSSQTTAIRDFSRLYNPWETIVLTSAQDIPGFSRDQLDPDLRGLALAPTETHEGTVTLSIVYAWTRVGGVLARYRFRTDQGQAPRCCGIIVLQSGLGNAAYLV